MKKLLKNTIAAVVVILGIGLGLGIGQKNYVQAAQDTYSLSMAEDNKWYYYKNGVVDTGYTLRAQGRCRRIRLFGTWC